MGNRSLSELRRALSDDGVYVMISGRKARWVRPVDRMIAGRLRFAFGSRRFANFPATVSVENLTELASHVAAGEVRPIIDRVYPLARTPDAMRYLATGHARAKVVIDVAGDAAAGVASLADQR